jgi:hypothetical protein
MEGDSSSAVHLSDTLSDTSVAVSDTSAGTGAGTIEDMQDDDARRVWLLWDCEDLGFAKK